MKARDSRSRAENHSSALLFAAILVALVLGLGGGDAAEAWNCEHSGLCYWCKRIGGMPHAQCLEILGAPGYCKCDDLAGGCVAWQTCYDPGFAPEPGDSPELSAKNAACRVRARTGWPVASPAWDTVEATPPHENGTSQTGSLRLMPAAG
jgi:hypothetical protein